MDTRDTVVRVHGMSGCVKYQNRTRTRGTRDPITTGIPIPMPNPREVLSYDQYIVWELCIRLWGWFGELMRSPYIKLQMLFDGPMEESYHMTSILCGSCI